MIDSSVVPVCPPDSVLIPSGILISDNTAIQVENGDLSITGTSQSPGTDNFGVDIRSGILQSLGEGNIFLTANAPDNDSPFNLAGTINTQNLVSLSTNQDLIFSDLDIDNPLALISTAGNIQTGNITSNGEDVRIQADGSIITGNIFPRTQTASGNIFLTAGADISTGELNSSLLSGNSGEVSIESRLGNISIDTINTRVSFGNAGSVVLSAPTGNIETVVDGIQASTAVGNGGAVEILAGGSVTVQGPIDTKAQVSANQSTGQGGDITVRSGDNLTINGQILARATPGGRTSGPISAGRGGNVALFSGGSITIAGDPVAIDTRSQTVVIGPNSQASAGGDITVIAVRDISIDGRLISPSLARLGATPLPLSGSIASEAGDIIIQAGGSVDLRSGSTAATPQSILTLSPTRSGNVLIEAGDNINFIGEDQRSDINANSILSGEIIFRAGGGINLNLNLDDSGIQTTGQNITFSANDDIQIQNAPIFTGLESPLNTLATVGNVNLTSENGGVFLTEAITTQNTVGNSGNVTIEALTEIQADVIDTSSLISNAGNVVLDPIGDIQVSSINTTAPNGAGGTIDITAGQSFRATDSFTDFNGINASISSAGSSGNGPITIRHGGNGFIPFTVGDASQNGTQAAITTGSNTILPTQAFFSPIIQGDIRIITAPQQEVLVDIEDVSINVDEANISNSSDGTAEPAYVTITYNDVEDIETVLEFVEDKFQEQYEDYYGNSLEPETSANTPLQDELNTDQSDSSLESSPNSVANVSSEVETTLSEPPLANDASPSDSRVIADSQTTSSELSNTNSPDEPSGDSNQTSPDISQSSSSEATSPEQTTSNNQNSDPASSNSVQTLLDVPNDSLRDNELEESSASNSLEVTDNSEQTLVFDSILGQHIIDSPSSQNQTTESDNSQGTTGISDGRNNENDSTVVDAQNTIRRIESQTGAKPAIIYAFFAPGDQLTQPVTPSENIPEDIVTQQFTSKEEMLWAFNTNGSLPTLLGQSINNNNQYGCDGREDHELFLVLVTSEEDIISKRVLNTTCTEVIETAREFRIDVTEFESNYLNNAQQLYEWLIRPLTTELQQSNINNLVFIMDQGLRATPLAALHDGQEFLVQNYSLGLMPSLNMANTQYQDIQDSQVLPAGISDFETTGLDDLPAVPFEISNITENWLGNAAPLLDTEATRANLRDARSDSPYGIVHLATHALFERGNPNQSYIQLWDEKLRLSDVRKMGWNSPAVELLILSACETAKDSYEAELGFAGFASQAGVKSTLASLWQVSDIGTAGLMIEFYTKLRSSETSIKSEALRQAQLAMLNGTVELNADLLSWSGGSVPLSDEIQAALSQGDGIPDDLSHPFYWSGFTLVGSPW